MTNAHNHNAKQPQTEQHQTEIANMNDKHKKMDANEVDLKVHKTVNNPASNNSASETSSLTSQAAVNKSIVPVNVTYGLLGFNVFLNLLITIFEPTQLSRITIGLLNLGLHLIVIPMLFVFGSKLMNKFQHEHIAPMNAFTLGLLISSVSILWRMGASS